MPVGEGSLRRVRQQGFTLLVVLGLVALMGIGLALAGPTWQAQSQREREREWVRIGTAYAKALLRYRQESPGSARQYPESPGELLLDVRFVGVRRHLRELYPDPLSPGQDWEWVRDRQQRVVGVRSRSTAQPFLTQAPAGSLLQRVGTGDRYQDWVFTPERDAGAVARR